MKHALATLLLFALTANPLFPEDSRHAKPVTLNDYHPFRKVDSKEAWEKRQKHIVQRIKVGSGLWPEPTKTPLNTNFYEKRDFGDFSITNVRFESFPGHWVTGSLFQPSGDSLKTGLRNGKRPAVLCPHGHWSDARFYHTPEARALQAIANGEERFLNAAHNHIRARCIQLARMGCNVFHYDMLGNSDSIQFPIHRRGPRPHLESKTPGEWGLHSTMAVAYLQTNFGIQTWNSVRALDFLLTLPDTDGSRLMATGASGGGTQTQMLAAIDDRIDASFPCVMPSTAMQGGCTCENTHYLRIGQGNMDIAAAVAPRPQGMTAADDWTIELKTKGYPDLVDLYGLVGAKNKYEAYFDIHFKHNYNHVSRTHMYNFVNRHFSLGLKAPVLERDFPLMEKSEFTVWDESNPVPGEKGGPAVGDDHEKALLKWWAQDAQEQLSDTKTRQSILAGALEVLIGREMPTANEAEAKPGIGISSEIIDQTQLALLNKTHNEEVPATLLSPPKPNGETIIWLLPEGKAGFDKGYPHANKLLGKGFSILVPDLFGQGESAQEGTDYSTNPKVQYPGDATKPGEGWRLSSAYFYGYNHSLFAKRVHDILTCVAYLQGSGKAKEVHLLAVQGTGHWAAAARAVAGPQIARAAIDTNGFRFANLCDQWHSDFLPGAAKYGDIGGFLELSAPHPLILLDNDKALQEQTRQTYGDKSSAFHSAENMEELVRFISK